ncbi:right-handed parallel beta-helix repeat-containing protein [Paenibacillus ginsengarvi]|uniref:Twin-arginine translocation signal domain-containing protein n=1 Tax=Paenibacillus ginsengarvi TaxID=400777 RepID=A0A3B0AJ97_9BACL|nr:right-handed parallel beta-helix repeat-containing protein [Paenibacillus ginsengarvi]RKN60749.1 twin-arginine translocation signal domain-containing protein [Paenibacillus ginsengarvi]
MLNEKMEQQEGKGLDKEQPEELGIHVSRRKLLTAFGMAGAAIAAGSMLPGPSTAYGKEGASVAESVYEELHGKGKVPQLKAADLIIATTIAELRANSDPDPKFLYFIRDKGQEGHFYVDPADTTSVDNTGTILMAASGARLKRMMIDDSIDVRWFGAKGNGTADDTAATLGAIGYVSSAFPQGGVLYFPNGKYRVTDGFTLTGQKVSFRGDKAEIFLDNSSDIITVLTFLGCTDFFVEGIKISSSKTTKLHSKQAHGIFIKDSGKFKLKNLDISYRTDAIHIQSCDNFTLEGSDVYYLGEEGIRIGGSRNWRVAGNRIHHHNGDGILLKHAGASEGMYNGEIIGNFLYDGVNTFGLTSTIGGGVTCNEEVTGTAERNIHNLVISGNTFKNLRYGIGLTSITNFTISGNTIQNVKTAGIRMDNSNVNNPSHNPGGESAITGNTVENVTDGEGIQFATNQAIVEKVSITGNHVRWVTHAVTQYPGIAASNAVVSGNMVSDCKILLQASNCTITGNRFLQGGFSSSDAGSNAIKLFESFVFTGNTFEDTKGHIGIGSGSGVMSGNSIKTGSNFCAILLRNNPSGNVYVMNNSFECPNTLKNIAYDPTVTPSGSGKISCDFTLARAIQRYDAAIPADGSYTPLSIIWNKDVGKGKPLGHVCITGGTPGVWAPFGYIGSVKNGTVTISALTDSVIVAHGMGLLPSYVSPTPLGNTGHLWITDMTTTHFTIRCSAAPTADTLILWEAKA